MEDLKKCQDRVDEPTPNGGDYSVAYYMNDDRNPCEPKYATMCEIVEYKNDGTPIMSTLGFCNSEASH